VVENGLSRVTLRQRDPVSRRGLTWTQRLQVALGYADRVELVPAQFTGPSVELKTAGRAAPLYVLPNGGGIGYGEMHLDRASLTWLVDHEPDIDDALTRGCVWVTLWDAMLDGELRPDRIIDLAVRALPRETDELNAERILVDLTRSFWQFIPDTVRTARAPQLERVLRAGLSAATTTSLKAAYFAGLRDMALTPETVAWLAAVWREDERIPGVTLAETDYIVLAEELAVRAVDGWRMVLAQQIERTKNPDRKARLRFVVPALSADASERDAFFVSLKDVANRRHEPWVLDGLRYLHHPLRANLSAKYIRPSLELLREIQETGDIFFPARWTEATLRGHQSVVAATAVRTFVSQTPRDYPDRLRRIVLSAADDLFRATKILGTRPAA
jgi:aminopeptidase N